MGSGDFLKCDGYTWTFLNALFNYTYELLNLYLTVLCQSSVTAHKAQNSCYGTLDLNHKDYYRALEFWE